MRGEKIFYTGKRKRHRHAREIFFHREAVKISSGGKNPYKNTQSDVILIKFYIFLLNTCCFILTFQNNCILLHWNSTRTPNNSTHKPATRLRTKKKRTLPHKNRTQYNLFRKKMLYLQQEKKTITQNCPTGKNEQSTNPQPHTH